MNSKLLTALLTAASAVGFAAEPITSVTVNEQLPVEIKQQLATESYGSRNWFGYMRMGLADSRPTDAKRVLPGVGVGVRFALPVGAIDLSASYTGNDAFADESASYFYTLPRVSYLYYMSPTKQQSFYGGAGLAYASLKTIDAQVFSGIVPSVSLGYEMNRLQNWHSFIQFDISQPVLATSIMSPYTKLASLDLGPIIELSVGFGY